MFSTTHLQAFSGLPDHQVKRLVQTFAAELDRAPQLLRGMHQAGDWAGIGRLAHTLTPSFNVMGIPDGAALLVQLNAACAYKPDTFVITDLVTQLLQVIADLSGAITEYLYHVQPCAFMDVNTK